MPKDIYIPGPDGTLVRTAYVSPDPPGSRTVKARFQGLRIDALTLAGVGREGPANERRILVMKSIDPKENKMSTEQQTQQGGQSEERLARLEAAIAEIKNLVVQKQTATEPKAGDFTHEIVLGRDAANPEAIVIEAQKGVFPLKAREDLSNLVVPVLKHAERVKVSFTPGAGRVSVESPNKGLDEVKNMVTEVTKQIGEIKAEMAKQVAGQTPTSATTIPASKAAEGSGDGKAPVAPAAPARDKSQQEMDEEFLNWMFPEPKNS